MRIWRMACDSTRGKMSKSTNYGKRNIAFVNRTSVQHPQKFPVDDLPMAMPRRLSHRSPPQISERLHHHMPTTPSCERLSSTRVTQPHPALALQTWCERVVSLVLSHLISTTGLFTHDHRALGVLVSAFSIHHGTKGYYGHARWRSGRTVFSGSRPFSTRLVLHGRAEVMFSSIPLTLYVFMYQRCTWYASGFAPSLRACSHMGDPLQQ
jgi:hypothetical protein